MTSLTISLSAVAQSGQAVEAAVQDSAASARSLRVAEALQYLGPFPLFACFLSSVTPAVAAVDESGSPRSDWDEALLDPLRRAALDGEEASLEQPSGLPITGPLVVAPISIRGRHFGALAVGASAGESDSLQGALSLVASRLAAALLLSEELGHGEAQRRDWLASVAETTSIVAHEFNNFLNGMMLHLALMRQDAPKQMAAELDVMKRLASDAASLVKRLQQYNSRRRGPLTPTDLNAAVRRVLDRRPMPASVTALTLDLVEGLPPVQASTSELDRLLDLLLRQAGGAMESRPGPITVRTAAAARKVVLRFEDNGPNIDAEAMAKLFEPFYLARPGTEEPGLALCHTLARRLHANIRAENRPEGGVAFIVEFTPVATPAS